MLKTAVVGVRGVGGVHFRALASHPRSELVAVADLDTVAARRLVDEQDHGSAPTVFASLDEMLDGSPRLEAVIIATPHHLHAPMSLAALEAGLHVYVEKPIAIRISDADRMVEAALQRQRVLAVGHQYRTYPGNARLKQLIEADEIGSVQRIVWQWLDTRPESYYDRDPWRSSWAHAGGGVLLNQASHDIDLLCWLFGPPAEVSATLMNRGHRHEVEDTALATVRFTSGALASLQFSTWDRCLNYRQIAGDIGSIVWQDERDANVLDRPEVFRLGRYPSSLTEIITDANAAVTGRPVPVWEDVQCEQS
ncbi:MAG: Gfo/Idh/MocA family oxidoreductase, partial [Candidatus Latescibacteria bacterium]|nr:Gfo/Idh/MocA family oxidoreductase [Candidatus Latescibacterota bacterium]